MSSNFNDCEICGGEENNLRTVKVSAKKKKQVCFPCLKEIGKGNYAGVQRLVKTVTE